MTKVGLLAKLEGVTAHGADGAMPSAAISLTGATKPFIGAAKNEANPRARSSIGRNQQHLRTSSTIARAA